MKSTWVSELDSGKGENSVMKLKIELTKVLKLPFTKAQRQFEVHFWCNFLSSYIVSFIIRSAQYKLDLI